MLRNGNLGVVWSKIYFNFKSEIRVSDLFCAKFHEVKNFVHQEINMEDPKRGAEEVEQNGTSPQSKRIKKEIE